MKFNEFRKIIKKILDTDLPSGVMAVNAGRSLSNECKIGRTAFFEKMGVKSEAEYKRICMDEGKIMFHAHIGLGTWKATADALEHILRATTEGGFTVDRVGICLDRRMGLPSTHRNAIPAETGPMLDSKEDWAQVGQCVPIQPHMGDFMIGFPASADNTIHALKAGVTTIGNLSQYFAHEVPSWRDHIATTVETVRALALMASFRDQGAVIHSYLEDGFGALFQDCNTIAGWAYLEHYIIEDLIGGKLAHCIGGLTTDPIKRAGWVFTLKEIHGHDCIGSMIYGDTISFTNNFTVNRAIVAEYLMWDIMAQLECPTGHAVLPLPVTESFRIPSAQEIVDAQVHGRQVEKAARRLWPQMDFSSAHEFSQRVIVEGKAVFNRALEGLKEAGADIRDPVQLLYVLKMIRPAVFEEMFGKGTDGDLNRDQDAGIPTDIGLMALRCTSENRSHFQHPDVIKGLKGKRMLIASTDVHEHAIRILTKLLSEAGADMIYLGAEKDPLEVAANATAHHVDAVLISTHNGMALQYADQLKGELARHGSTAPVIMGGVLNQKLENKSLPMDVSDELKQLGFRICARLSGGLGKLLE